MSERLTSGLRAVSDRAAAAHEASTEQWAAQTAARVHRARRARGTTLAIATAAVLAAVGLAGSALAQRPAPVPPANGEHAAVLDLSPVLGSGSCRVVAEQPPELVEGATVYVSSVECRSQMSDPRVSGTAEFTLVARVVDGAVGYTWTATDMVLTTEGGVWRGTASGVSDTQGAAPFARGTEPFEYGEARLVGEGTYEGLVYRQYLMGTTGLGTDPGYSLTGWVESAD